MTLVTLLGSSPIGVGRLEDVILVHIVLLLGLESESFEGYLLGRGIAMTGFPLLLLLVLELSLVILLLLFEQFLHLLHGHGILKQCV